MAGSRRDARSSPQDAERDNRAALADVVANRRHDIETRWARKVQEEGARDGKTIIELREAVGEYLVRLSHALHDEESIEASGTDVWSAVAREHALTHAHLGVDIDQVVRAFILLRRTLFEVAQEEHLIVDGKHSEILADLIDAAIGSSVKSYTESRDLAARRQQAENIGFLTHELRNPLSTATMAATFLRRKPEIAAAETKTLDMLDRSLRRIKDHIEGMLLTQRLDAHEMECRPVDISLDKIMAEATRAAELEAGQKGIGFTVRYDPGIRLYVDPGLTTSALQNVVDNAVKFTDHGRVSVTADSSDVSEVVIHVHDNCDGLSAEELETIFEPFKRAHAGKAGTGLGLAIARRAVEAGGGRIGAEPGGSGGCHFWLALPKPKNDQRG